MNLRHRGDARGNPVQKHARLRRGIACAGFADSIGLEPDQPSQKGEAVADTMIGFSSGVQVLGGRGCS